MRFWPSHLYLLKDIALTRSEQTLGLQSSQRLKACPYADLRLSRKSQKRQLAAAANRKKIKDSKNCPGLVVTMWRAAARG